MSWKLEDIPDLTGKVMIVTGANSGLGFETTKELARKGAKVVMGCRNPQRADTAKQKIQNEIPDADLDIILLDLASQKSVENFAHQFKQKYNRLDALINNAGIMAAPYSETVDGFENHFATNYLGHFALTGRLFDLLEATPNARVVSVSSLAYFFGNKINFDNLYYEHRKGYGRWRAYGRSKMEMLLFAYEMQRRLTRTGKSTISLAAHPGLAQTNIMPAQANNAVTKKLLTWLSYILKPTIYGAMPLIRAATDQKVKGGEYFGPSKDRMPDVVKSNKASHNLDTAKKLWKISEELTGIYYLD
ncbi:MAG: SDR family NAD(P)-dependent oxidoreductase [Erysipelotrichaceae bacterium]|nr:SDR family NAD(P)-dependent oxidoreductase [Erysipelotrichaceae bacterium]